MTFQAMSLIAEVSNVGRRAMHSNRVPQRPGYMLVELVVVLVLLGLLTSATLFTLRRPLQTARIDQVISRIEQADRRARTQARHTGNVVRLSIDAQRGTVQLQSASDNSGLRDQRDLALRGRLTIARCLSSRRTGINEDLVVHYSPNGHSDTFAVGITNDDTDSSSLLTWLVIIGPSGQTIRTNEDATVEAILRR